tara:strand:- start:598 stop:969 length:372 start_codon:yes stop_codon:yes gene_type:complete
MYRPQTRESASISSPVFSAFSFSTAPLYKNPSTISHHDSQTIYKNSPNTPATIAKLNPLTCMTFAPLVPNVAVPTSGLVAVVLAETKLALLAAVNVALEYPVLELLATRELVVALKYTCVEGA